MKLSELQQILDQSTKPLLVDFWAAWCVPCKVTKPVLESLAEEFADEVGFIAVDADASPEVIKEYKVMGIPTLIAFQDGKPVTRVTGAKDRAFYEGMFRALAAGEEVQPGVAPGDRMVRLTAGFLLAAIGAGLGNWLVLILGGVIGFWGIYDRCPIWAAITRKFQGN